MTTETFVVAYEGDEGDSHVLDYAIARAKHDGAHLHIVHILEWSPFKFLTPEELEERHVRRAEEMTRAETVVMKPALDRAKAAGVTAGSELRHGNVVDLIAAIAAEKSASMIFVGRAGTNSISARIFGSVPIGLAQVAPVPVVIVP